MADQTTHHVVNSDRSTAEQSSVDAYAKQFHSESAASGNHTSPAHSQSTDSAPVASHPTPFPDQYDPVATQDVSGKNFEDATLATEERPHAVPHLSVNGGQDDSSAVEDGIAGDNIGSDTDTSRAGSVDQSKEENRHLRSNSNKKPTSFKAVSVTKTFLAKTAGATPAPPKIGSKSPVASTLQPVAKPRLVAKSGSGLRDIPRARSNDSAGAPDGKMVWNKNQPVPLPPPKQFTDEELKQQYGIHLASRLQEDEDTGKSKWADIDDDEEDWTPETVEWMDGTKSSINAAEQPPSVPEPEPVKPVEETKPSEQAPAAKPVLTALKRPTASATSSTTKTILRPGAAQQARQSGGGPNGSLEKQTLIAKANALTPVKSPWAPLPPVERAPLPINPPTVSQLPPKFGQRDPHGFDNFVHQHEPAREIAADTFDRSSWREGERANRELFNSQSGRYEPAPEYRRNSRQPDNFRQPAVLQRTSHQNGPSPAEPSAAFQTRTSAQMDGSSYSRRRGSSVSGGNAFPRDRRMSSAKPHDLPRTQDETHVDSAIPHEPAFPSSVPEPVAPPTQSADTAAPSQSVDHPTTQSEPVLSMEEELARQKKVLQESREAAKRRKQEEWEREEAEKKERIRKRLEALGEQTTPAPVQAPAQPEAKPSPAKATDDSVPAVKPVKSPTPETPHSLAQSSRQEPATSPLKQSSPRKPRLPESGPASFTQNQTPFTRPPPKTVFEEPQLPGLKQQSPQLPNRTPYQRQSSAPGVSGSGFSSPGDHKVQPVRLQNMSTLPNAESFALWGSGGMPKHPTSGSNVWGPPTNNRHIGNGTFDTGYSRIPSGQLQQHQGAPFSSPAPFGRQYPQRISPQGFTDQQVGPASTLETRMSEPSGAPQINGTSPLPEPARTAYQPAPIAPPQKNGSRSQHAQPRDTSAWTSFAMQAQHRERDEAARLAAEKGDQGAQQQRWTETFKQTQMDDVWLGGPRKLVGTEKIVHGADASAIPHGLVSPAPPVSQTSAAHQVSGQGMSIGEQRPTHRESTVRLPTGPSSFNRGFQSPVGTPGAVGRITPLATQSGNASPSPQQPLTPTSAPQQSRFFPSALYGGSPPPEEADHPVCGDMTRYPHVKLPSARPKVKLPPALPASQAKPGPVIMPQRAPSYRVGPAQPLVANQDWQARFNGLFGRAQISTTAPPSPPTTPPKAQAPSPAVSSASKAELDFMSAPRIATLVSLPLKKPLRFEAISKPGVDDIFDGELSFGSTPRVFLPRDARYAGPIDPRQLAATRSGSRSNKPHVEARSKQGLPTIILEDPSTEVIRMKLPQAWAIAKEIPFQLKNKPTTGQQGRRGQAKPNKNKRNTSGANLSADSESPKTASPTPRGTGSRNPSFQNSPAPTTERPTKDSPLLSGQSTGGNENAPKKSSWAKPARGRGKNIANKPRV